MKFSFAGTALAVLLTECHTHAQLESNGPKRRPGLKASSTPPKSDTTGETDLPRARELAEENESFSMITTELAYKKFGVYSKTGKSSKENGEKNLIAIIGPAPGYTATKPSGIVSARFNPDGAFLFSLDAAGLDPSCTGAACSISIRSGTSCDDPVDLGEEYFSTKDNPWGGIIFDTYDNVAGFTNSASRVYNGFSSEENEGHVVTLGDMYGGMSACGVLEVESKDKHKSLTAEMGAYPGYMGLLTVSGEVSVTYRIDGTFLFKYSLNGVKADCVNCGIHIHEGTSCDTNEEVKGHGWNSEFVQDLWTFDGGAWYNSDGEGRAEGSFNIYNGFSFGKNLGHAVVVHTQSGARIACGVLHANI